MFSLVSRQLGVSVNDIAKWLATLQNLIGFIDLRSYGQMSASGFEFILILVISTRYSYFCAHRVRDPEDQLEAALGGSQSLKAAHGTVFEV